MTTIETTDTDTFVTIDFPNGETMSLVVDLDTAENIVGVIESLTGIKLERF